MRCGGDIVSAEKRYDIGVGLEFGVAQLWVLVDLKRVLMVCCWREEVGCFVIDFK